MHAKPEVRHEKMAAARGEESPFGARSKAGEEGPQIITVRGDDAVVVVGAQEWRELGARSKGGLVEFFRNSPLAKVKLDLSRSRDTGRKVDL